jgi:hypothetical protein
LAGVLVTLTVVALDTGLHRRDGLGRAAQPGTIRYPDQSTHYVGLLERRSWIFGRHQAYELYIGRDSSLSYGHHVVLDFTGGRPRLAGATWQAEGVLVRLGSGHEVFVPARYFMFGR